MPRRRTRVSPLYLLLFLLVALLLGLYQAGYLEWLGISSRPPVVQAPPGAWYQVYFTAPDTADAAPHTGGIDARVAADIEAAQESVDIATFDLDLQTIARALLQAHERGVRVRLVIDDENLSDETVLQTTRDLSSAGIPIVYDQRQAFMHNKFVVIDRRIVWLGSWNLTDNDTYRNNNNFLRLELAPLAENYTREFEEMFLDHAFGPKSPENTPYPVLLLDDGTRIETYFSPEDNPRAAVLSALERAKQEIVFMAFSFTDEEIAQILIRKAKDGVVVHGVLEARNTAAASSIYDLLRGAGVDVRLDGNPRVMHHKVFVIDGRITITGSFNFTQSAARENDENLVIIENADLARAYQEEFERVYGAGHVE
ncbi:MAG: phospholipase D-like domain-containing protein [Chloroflexia bacterium]